MKLYKYMSKRVKEERIKGYKEEKKFKLFMKKKYHLELLETEKYYFCDYFCKNFNVIIELKSRNIYKNDYETTIVGLDKIERFIEFNNQNYNRYRFFIVFKFIDGYYYFVHREDYQYNYKPFKRNLVEGRNDKEKPYIFFPVNELIPITNIMNDINSKIIVKYNM